VNFKARSPDTFYRQRQSDEVPIEKPLGSNSTSYPFPLPVTSCCLASFLMRLPDVQVGKPVSTLFSSCGDWYLDEASSSPNSSAVTSYAVGHSFCPTCLGSDCNDRTGTLVSESLAWSAQINASGLAVGSQNSWRDDCSPASAPIRRFILACADSQVTQHPLPALRINPSTVWGRTSGDPYCLQPLAESHRCAGRLYEKQHNTVNV
jgi:hypothetical protein